MTEDAARRQLAAVLRGLWEEALAGGVAWKEVARRAELEGVAPLLYESIHRNGHSAEVPAEILSRLRLRYHQTQAANLLRFAVLADVLRRLAEAGIAVVVLKGAALAELVYRDCGLRPMCDLDLLVRDGDVAQALDFLRNAGYRRAGKPELRPGFAREFQSELELLSPGTRPVQVEIHWRPIGPLFAVRYVEPAAVWQRVEPARISQQSAYVLGPEDWLLHQMAHAVYKHRQITLQNLCDVDRLVRYLGARLDWEKLREIGEAFHWLPAAVLVLSQAAEHLGTPLPDGFLPRAQAYRLPAVEQLWVDWWLAPGRPERLHVIPDWLALPNTAARLRILLAYLLPSREYIEACYPGRESHHLPWLYLHRFVTEAGL